MTFHTVPPPPPRRQGLGVFGVAILSLVLGCGLGGVIAWDGKWVHLTDDGARAVVRQRDNPQDIRRTALTAVYRNTQNNLDTIASVLGEDSVLAADARLWLERLKGRLDEIATPQKGR